MKKLILLFLAFASFTVSHAQSDWIKIGVHAGSPLGDTSDTSSFVLGVDVKYQFLNTNSYAIGISTGYSNYFGEDEFDDFGIIPIAGLFRYYPTKHFFLGADLGYGIFTDDNYGDNGFYYRPEMGFHNDKWNVYGFYQGISSGEFSPASVGIGISYNIIRS
ncbi:hypothetical protein FNB79_16285 [Formosa sediminum]|uniref:Porin family protein n=1 Tax=Formosa sediminum TaxID=2594004 RepID=A0A516GVA5_9FLAO|nr:hypothetical protein [Formosa sediminum]QDO95461.1 hypothetical protein FNB79_16285 [Formosa sediminum]